MTKVWVAYFYDPMPIVGAIFLEELDCRRFAETTYQVAEVEIGKDVGDQLR